MSFAIVWVRRSAKDRDAIPQPERQRIIDAIERFAASGQGDVKRLQGSADFRLRAGDWRVIFAVDPSARRLTVLRVAHRREVYR